MGNEAEKELKGTKMKLRTGARCYPTGRWNWGETTFSIGGERNPRNGLENTPRGKKKGDDNST